MSASIKIDIQASTFKRLQQHAKPFVDTIDMVINKAVDALEDVVEPYVNGMALPVPISGGEIEIDPRSLPSLTYTKVLDASIDGEPIAGAKWNLLRNEAIRRLLRRGLPLEKVRQVCPVNMVKGRKEDEGYRYLTDIDISVQGMDANGACQALLTAAMQGGISIDVGFMWRLRDDAANPGRRGRLRVGQGFSGALFEGRTTQPATPSVSTDGEKNEVGTKLHHLRPERTTWQSELTQIIQRTWGIGEAFVIDDIYQFEGHFRRLYPGNHFVRQKLQQMMQSLRDEGIVGFVDYEGSYRRTR